MARSNLNLKWFINNHEMLIDKYQDMFVAIDNQDVVGSDKRIEREEKEASLLSLLLFN
jgi:hypothetical protein